jgi:hypothetical protein
LRSNPTPGTTHLTSQQWNLQLFNVVRAISCVFQCYAKAGIALFPWFVPRGMDSSDGPVV